MERGCLLESLRLDKLLYVFSGVYFDHKWKSVSVNILCSCSAAKLLSDPKECRRARSILRLEALVQNQRGSLFSPGSIYRK